MLEIGSLIDGKYKILNKVGQGGMSVVYLAMNEKANKQWAIKEVRKDGIKDFEVVKQSLVAETDMLKRLSHPSLPSIVDVIEDDDRFLIVMDYIQGNSLSKALEEYGALPQDKVIQWAKQLCDVLGYLHTRIPPIIYRDMKPANVMLKPDGTVTLIDFGTAREFKEKNLADTTCLGTVGYAAPEQFGGMGQTDARTDIYCLGATLYHLVTGMNPCEPPYEIKPIRQINPTLSSGFEKIILKCTQRDPNDRYQSAAELMYALEHYDEIDDLYRKKQKRKLGAFISTIVLSIASAITSIWGYNAAEAKKSENYEAVMQTADTFEEYCEAILIDPTRTEAYLEINKLFTEDFILDKYEAENFKKILLGLEEKNVNGYSERIDVLQQLKTGNPNGYKKVCYTIGETFLFYYDVSTERVRYEDASVWFIDTVDEYPIAQIYCDISDCLQLIDQYKGAQILQTQKMYDAYDELWDMIKDLKNKADEFDSVDSKLQVWNEIVKIMDSKIATFLEIITADDMVTLLEDVSQEADRVTYSVLQDSIDELQANIDLAIERIRTAK